MGVHLVKGQFQSDKYPTTPAGKVPLSVKDKTAQDLLWEYAQRRRAIDAEFSDDLECALRQSGYVDPKWAEVIAFLLSQGYRTPKALPADRWAAVRSFFYTDAILVGDFETVLYGFEDRFCYQVGKAEAALQAWDGTGEPAGWHRNPKTGRRRTDGDPDQEYIAW